MTARPLPRWLRPLQLLALTCAALVFVLTLAHVLQAPGSRALNGAQWIIVQNSFYGGFAVVGGAAEVFGLAAAAVLAVHAWARIGRSAALAPAVAAVCFLGTLLSFFFGNRPVNERVATWTADTLPPDWSAYRETWEAAHAISAVLGGIAFLALASALIWGRRTSAQSPNGGR